MGNVWEQQVKIESLKGYEKKKSKKTGFQWCLLEPPNVSFHHPKSGSHVQILVVHLCWHKVIIAMSF